MNVVWQEPTDLLIRESGKTVLEKKYTVRVLPEPSASLNYSRNTTLAKSKILLNPFLRFEFLNSNYKGRIDVVSFQAALISGTDTINTYNQGRVFSMDLKKLIQQSQPGDKILFHKIYRDCCCRVPTPYSFWIVVD